MNKHDMTCPRLSPAGRNTFPGKVILVKAQLHGVLYSVIVVHYLLVVSRYPLTDGK